MLLTAYPNDGLKQKSENFLTKFRSGSTVTLHLKDFSTTDFSKLLTAEPKTAVVIFSNKLNVSSVLPLSDSFAESLLNAEIPSTNSLDLASLIFKAQKNFCGKVFHKGWISR